MRSGLPSSPSLIPATVLTAAARSLCSLDTEPQALEHRHFPLGKPWSPCPSAWLSLTCCSGLDAVHSGKLVLTPRPELGTQWLLLVFATIFMLHPPVMLRLPVGYSRGV